VTGLIDGDELDRPIDALRARLLAASPGSSAEAELTDDLTALLFERYERRMAASDQADARDDLEEVVRRLDAVMARSVPDAGWHASLAWNAGLARAERWALLGDPADRDAAIGYLSALPATLGAVNPAVHAVTARLLAARACDREPGAGQDADLDARAGQPGGLHQRPGHQRIR